MTFRKLLVFAYSAGQKQARWRALYHIRLYEPHPWASANTDRTRKWMALSEKLSLILIPFHTSLFPLPRKSEGCTKNCFWGNCTIEIFPPQSLSKLQLDMVDFAGPLCREDLELLQSASRTFNQGISLRPVLQQHIFIWAPILTGYSIYTVLCSIIIDASRFNTFLHIACWISSEHSRQLRKFSKYMQYRIYEAMTHNDINLTEFGQFKLFIAKLWSFHSALYGSGLHPYGIKISQWSDWLSVHSR